MSDAVTIDASRLRETLGQGFDLSSATQTKLARVLAEHSIKWQLRLKGPTISAPGEGLWPVGNILNLGRSNERYLDDDDSRGRASGRSLAGWDVDQQGLNVKATNTAVDARRNMYAEHVHFAGEPEGQAVDDAFDAFEDEFARKATAEMADIIEAALVRF